MADDGKCPTCGKKQSGNALCSGCEALAKQAEDDARKAGKLPKGWSR